MLHIGIQYSTFVIPFLYLSSSLWIPPGLERF
jgi:hypothetical protein